MEENLEECMKYFKNNEYKRIIQKLRKKYESYGKWEGNITIENPTKGERETLSGFMKKDYSRNKSITISVDKFNKRLQETRFSNIPLKTIIEKYEGKTITHNKEKQKTKQEQEEIFYQNILEGQKGTKAYELIKKQNIEIIKKNLKLQYNKNKDNLEKSIKEAILCFNNIPKEVVKLPVFSADTIRNPHGLDKDKLTGQIFTKMLAINLKQEMPKSTEELAHLYYMHNLLIDDVSNMVLCKNIRAITKKGEHLGWKRILRPKRSYSSYNRKLIKNNKTKCRLQICTNNGKSSSIYIISRQIRRNKNANNLHIWTNKTISNNPNKVTRKRM